MTRFMNRTKIISFQTIGTSVFDISESNDEDSKEFVTLDDKKVTIWIIC